MNMNEPESTPLTPTPASSWTGLIGEGVSLRVPSGNVCLVRKSQGLNFFLKTGQVPNPLMKIIQQAMKKGRMDITETELTPDMLSAIGEMADKACVFLVIQPQVKAVPLNEAGVPIPLEVRERGDFLYVDQVDFEDKMFIFNTAVGGPSDVEQFRKEQAEYVGALPGFENVGNPAQRPPELR